MEREGEKGDSLRGYVKDQASLSDEEAEKLDEIAATCVEEVSRQDAKAIAVIQTFQSQFPGGKIPAGVKIPPPSKELKALQQERNEIILAARNKLVTDLAETGFNRVAKFVKSSIAPGVKPALSVKR